MKIVREDDRGEKPEQETPVSRFMLRNAVAAAERVIEADAPIRSAAWRTSLSQR